MLWSGKCVEGIDMEGTLIATKTTRNWTIEEVKGILNDFVDQWVPVGSRVTSDPPPVDTDEDWLVLIKSGFRGRFWADSVFGREDVECPDESEGYGGLSGTNEFESVRFGNVNLIVVSYDRKSFFDRFLVATNLAKRFNLRDKKHRIALFQGVLYGRDYG
jgi:hypothetical protein